MSAPTGTLLSGIAGVCATYGWKIAAFSADHVVVTDPTGHHRWVNLGMDAVFSFYEEPFVDLGLRMKASEYFLTGGSYTVHKVEAFTQWIRSEHAPLVDHLCPHCATVFTDGEPCEECTRDLHVSSAEVCDGDR